ncbi:hypothetical protein AHAS_Ahas12G0101000 [Arachis hypogaea]
MASRSRISTNISYSNSNSNVMGERFCNYGLRVLLEVSNSVTNPDREYYACSVG